MPKLSILVPAFNEEGGIVQTLEQLLGIAQQLDAEILVIDDGSTDRTVALAEPFTARGIRLLKHDVNRGYGASLKTGLRNSSAPVICITDADGTYPNDRIPELYSFIDRYDMVVGARTGQNVQIPWLRRPPKLVLNWLANILTGIKIPDLNSGLRVFKKDVGLRFMHLYPSGFSFTTTITLAMLNADYLVKFIPIDYFKREGASKIHPIKDTYRFLMLILRLTTYFNPLKIFLPIAFLLAAAAIFTGACDYGRSTGLSDKTVILTLSAGIVFVVGLLGDSISRRNP